MVDLQLLEKKFNTSNDRLKRIFTVEKTAAHDSLPDEEKEKIERDIKAAERIKGLIESRIQDSMQFNLKNYQLLGAVDLAWDSDLINRSVYPLRLYAQGKIDMAKCATSLEAAGFGQYVTKNEKGVVTEVNLPKFYETQVNLIRSILTRRLAAQSNKYANLYPFYSFEPRGTSITDKLKSDLVSQRMDVMADQYDHRHHQVQVDRGMMMYGNVVDFVRSAWEREDQWRYESAPPGVENPDPPAKKVVVKEGLSFVSPHPTRTFWDTNYPLPSLNSDTGCEWCGYWDVARYRDIHHNTSYWNRDKVSYSTDSGNLFSIYNLYFTQYYATITPPATPEGATASNDRKNSVGIYNSQMGDNSVIKWEFFWKLIPKDWDLGDYDCPVWVRFMGGGDSTIFYAEYLPSSPASVHSFNSNDDRLVNISFAHELMGFQDQLTQLFTHLMLCLQADHLKMMLVDEDWVSAENLKTVLAQLKGQASHPGTIVVPVSRSKMAEMNVQPGQEIVSLVETRSMAIDQILRGISSLIQMVERLAALSPQEQGQPAPREISATETNLIAGTTESVYGFISDSIDEGRAAKKRIMWESWMVLGQSEFRLPVRDRYPSKVIEAAGLKADNAEGDIGSELSVNGDGMVARYTVSGKVSSLEHDMIFTSRDGAERPTNTQAANVMVQLLQGVMSIPAVAQAIKKDQLFEMINEIFRKSGAGYDLKLELQPGEDNSMGPDPNQVITDIQGALEGLTKSSETNKMDIEQIKQVIQQAAAGPQAMPAP